jgi:hypothetical protein
LILSSSYCVVISGSVGTEGKTVAQISTGSWKAGQIAYVTNGDAGDKCLAMWDGTDWLRIALGAVIDSAA